MKHVDVFTDGACSGNPGPGGYGVILRYLTNEKELSEGFKQTTNNRMELLAAIEGLAALQEPCEVTLYSDSQYLINSIVKGWVFNWKRNGWRKSDGTPSLNIDLWNRLLRLLEVHNVSFIWVKGHNGMPENERCDKLATSADHSSVDVEYENLQTRYKK